MGMLDYDPAEISPGQVRTLHEAYDVLYQLALDAAQSGNTAELAAFIGHMCRGCGASEYLNPTTHQCRGCDRRDNVAQAERGAITLELPEKRLF